MKTILTAFLCALFFAFPALAGQPAQPTPDVSTELKLQQQKIDFFKERLDLQDKRIGDLGMFLGLAIALFGALITAVVVFFSLKSNREAVQAAKDEARKEIEQQAGKVIGDWIDQEGVRRIEEKLKPEIEAAIQKIHEAASPVIEKLAQETQNAHEHNQRQEQLFAEYSQKLGALTTEEERAVDEAAAQLDAKAPKDYRFSDWLMLGIKAYQENKFEIAEENFGKAAAAAEKPIDSARALFNKGVTLGQMGKNDEAIAVYDEVAKRYGDAPEAVLRAQVTKALYNMGNELEKQGKYREAITAFNKVGQSEDDGQLGELITMALIKMEQMAGERNNKGFAALREAKKSLGIGDEATAKSLLTHAFTDIELALACKPDWPTALGNQGYILFLQGRTDQAREILAKAIRLGGEKLRQDELADADIHPLPQDEAFKKLINSLPCA